MSSQSTIQMLSPLGNFYSHHSLILKTQHMFKCNHKKTWKASEWIMLISLRIWWGDRENGQHWAPYYKQDVFKNFLEGFLVFKNSCLLKLSIPFLSLWLPYHFPISHVLVCHLYKYPLQTCGLGFCLPFM